MPVTLAESFLVAARTAADLCLDDAVRARWSEESACAGMTIGGLAHHLAGEAGVRDAHDDEANVCIRAAAAEKAATGYDELAALSRPQRAPSSVSAF